MLKKFTLDAKKWCRKHLNNNHGRMCALGQYENQGGSRLDIIGQSDIWLINDNPKTLRNKVNDLKKAFAQKGIKMLVKGL